MTNHFNRRNPNYVEIKGGCVRLYDDGRVKHWDGDISTWRPGFGAFAATSAVGEDETRLLTWRKLQRART